MQPRADAPASAKAGIITLPKLKPQSQSRTLKTQEFEGITDLIN